MTLFCRSRLEPATGWLTTMRSAARLSGLAMSSQQPLFIENIIEISPQTAHSVFFGMRAGNGLGKAFYPKDKGLDVYIQALDFLRCCRQAAPDSFQSGRQLPRRKDRKGHSASAKEMLRGAEESCMQPFEPFFVFILGCAQMQD